MIVQFRMKNVLSFKDEAVLDMTAIPAYKEHDYNLVDVGNGDKLLRVAAIYGANASGKSNFYCGMDMFREIVLNSMNTVGEIEDNILKRNYFPFAFEDGQENSEFEIILSDNEAEYKYGFEYNADCVESEWLYKRNYKTNRLSTFIEREKQQITIGASIRRECDKYKEQIPKECLAVTFFSKLALKTAIFRYLFDEIRGMMIVDTDFYDNSRIIEKLLPNAINDNKRELLDFLNAIDTGIKDISYETIDTKIAFYTSHRGHDGKLHTINLFNESQGTIKSIMIFMFASSVIARNGAMIVDELNVKLHPLLLKFIVDLFYNKDSKAQLVYTTHDTTLMDKKFFRRDQIWFVQKDDFGYSKLVALSDYKVRSDASFEKDYLSGVYGGIPMLKEFAMKAGD